MSSFPAETIARSRVLVVGDVMLDRYWFGEVERISPRRRCLWCAWRAVKTASAARPTWPATSRPWAGMSP